MTFLQRYGFLLVLLAFFLVSLWGFAETNESEVRHAAMTECEIKSLIMTNGQDDTKLDWRQCVDPNETTDRFWDGFWENHQSEYAQLFLQGLLLIAFGSWLNRKDQDDKIDAAEEGARRALRAHRDASRRR